MSKIERSEIDKRLREARERVRGAGLPALLSGVDAGAFGTTSMNLGMLDALAEAVATARAVTGIGKEDPLFTAYVLTEEAGDRLASMGSAASGQDGKSSLPGEQYRDLASGSADAVFPLVLKDCAAFLRFYKGHPDSGKQLRRDTESLECLRSYFGLLSNTIRRLGPERLERKLETPRLRFEGWKVSPAELGEPNDLLPVGLGDIVGNEAYIRSAKRLARDVAGFDLSRAENPKRVRNQVLFVLGSPGCGKTVTAHAVLRYFLELCEKTGLPARTRVIRRTDWASSYQNQSAQRLLEIFREEVFDVPGVCGAYWPDIDTAFSGRGGGDIRQEEKSNLATLFGILDGTVGPKNGKWFLICDANTMRMDEAMLSRLQQTPLEAHGPLTPGDFVRLLRDVKLRGKERWLPLSDEDWAVVGERCAADKLSGRSIDAIAGRVLTAMEDFEEPDDYFGLSFDEKRRLIDELSRPVPSGRIMEFIDSHIRFEREAQERSAQEKFERRVEEINLHLSAQRAALSAMGRSGRKE